MSGSRKSFHDSFFVLLSNILEKTVFFLMFAFVAREFNKEFYGFMISSFALGNIVSSFFDFGFTFYFQREAAAGNKRFYDSIFSAIVFRFVCWLPFLAVVLLYAQTMQGSLTILIIVTTATFMFGINNDLNAVLNGQTKYRQSFYYLLIARSVLIFCFAVLFFLGVSTVLLISLFLISAIVHFILLAVKLDLFVSGRMVFSFNAVKTTVLFALPMSLGFIFNWVYDKIDVLVIGNLLDLQSVALYATAYSVYKLPQSLGNSIITPLYSTFSTDFAVLGKIQFSKHFKKILILITLAGVTTVALYIFADPIVKLIYSEKYAASGEILRVLSFGVPFLMLNGVTGIYLNSMRHDLKVTIVVFVAGILNIVLNLFLLPLYGITGAVYATIATEALILILQFFVIVSLKYRRQ